MPVVYVVCMECCFFFFSSSSRAFSFFVFCCCRCCCFVIPGARTSGGCNNAACSIYHRRVLVVCSLFAHAAAVRCDLTAATAVREPVNLHAIFEPGASVSVCIYLTCDVLCLQPCTRTLKRAHARPSDTHANRIAYVDRTHDWSV